MEALLGGLSELIPKPVWFFECIFWWDTSSVLYWHYLWDILQIRLDSKVSVATEDSSKYIPLRKKYIFVVATGLQLVLRYLGRVDSWEFIFSLDICCVFGGKLGGSWGFFRLRLMTKCAWGDIKSESLDNRILLCQFSSEYDSFSYLNSGHRRPCEFLKENWIETMWSTF